MQASPTKNSRKASEGARRSYSRTKQNTAFVNIIDATEMNTMQHIIKYQVTQVVFEDIRGVLPFAIHCHGADINMACEMHLRLRLSVFLSKRYINGNGYNYKYSAGKILLKH